jgi:hypothetical protein
MVNAPINFERLFPGGPVHADAVDMTRTLNDHGNTALVTVTLPEEMPLQESDDLAAELARLVPKNKPWLVVNRKLTVTAKLRALWKEKGAALSGKPTPLTRAAEFMVTRAERQEAELRAHSPQAFAGCLTIADLGALPPEGLPPQAVNP